jgi:proteasome assembly chaperone (PAC2) family protein
MDYGYIPNRKAGVSALWLRIVKSEIVSPKNPAMVVAVSTSIPQYRTLYSHARELANYMLRKMRFEKIATIYSSSFVPEVMVKDDGVSALPACFVHIAQGARDVLLFSGDTSPMEDQHQFARVLLDYAKDLGVKELFSVGTRWAESPVSPETDPEPNGFATDSVGVARLKKCGVKLVPEEPAPFFASIVVGLAKEYGMRGYKLSVDHGEPIPHPKSVYKMLGILSTLVGFDVPMDELRAQATSSYPPRQVGNSAIYH